MDAQLNFPLHIVFITLKEFNSILHWLSIHSFYLRMKNVLGLLLNLIIVK